MLCRRAAAPRGLVVCVVVHALNFKRGGKAGGAQFHATPFRTYSQAGGFGCISVVRSRKRVPLNGAFGVLLPDFKTIRKTKNEFALCYRPFGLSFSSLRLLHVVQEHASEPLADLQPTQCRGLERGRMRAEEVARDGEPPR